MKSITKKNLAAGLIGPLGLYPAFFIAWVVLALVDTYEGRASLESASDGLLLFLGMATVGLIYAYPLTIVFGLPSAALLRKLNLFKLPIVLLVSLIPVSILFWHICTNILRLAYLRLRLVVGCITVLVNIQMGIKPSYNKPQQSLPLVAGTAKTLRFFVCPCAGRYVSKLK